MSSEQRALYERAEKADFTTIVSKGDRAAAALALMEEIKRDLGGDPEIAHFAADAVLCALLRAEGYGLIADTFDDIGKWYA